MDMNNFLLDAAMISIKSLQAKKKNPAPTMVLSTKRESDFDSDNDKPIQHGLDESMKSINASLKSLNSSRNSVNPTYLKSMKRRRQGVRSRGGSVASERSVDASESAFRSSNINNSQRSSYGGVKLNGTVGTLTLIAGERLVFKPRDPRDKANVYTWPLDSILKHQPSGHSSGSCVLRLLSQTNSSKPIQFTFPDRTSLESIQSHLTSQLQPLRKYRKLKETLLATQRKLKEANRCIDEMQDANETLLISCDMLGRKCKSLSQDLQNQRQREHQQGAGRDRIAELEGRLRTLQPELESLVNEKTAMAICHEMDNENYEARIAALEQELAEERQQLEEERETTQKLLEDRELVDGLQMEMRQLSKELIKERQLVKELQSKLDGGVPKESCEAEGDSLRQQRDMALVELAHVKKERDNLLEQLEESHYQQDSIEGQANENNQSATERDTDESSAQSFPVGLVRSPIAPTMWDWALDWELPGFISINAVSPVISPRVFPFSRSLTPYYHWLPPAVSNLHPMKGAHDFWYSQALASVARGICANGYATAHYTPAECIQEGLPLLPTSTSQGDITGPFLALSRRFRLSPDHWDQSILPPSGGIPRPITSPCMFPDSPGSGRSIQDHRFSTSGILSDEAVVKWNPALGSGSRNRRSLRFFEYGIDAKIEFDED